MKVILSGYNIDTEVIKEAENAGIPKERLTPEVLSAAYARISRNPAPVNELRQMALNEVAKARKSNKNIIFGMGHHSVAEHAAFNFDIIDMSRLAIEELEHFRLCSFTEKSQRYITLNNDYVMPAELETTPFKDDLENLIKKQAEIYNSLHDKLHSILIDKHPELQLKKSDANMVDGWAKEDARYATLLCTAGQLGFTANARNLELIIKRLNASKLQELKDLAEAFYEKVKDVAPSIFLFTEPSDYDTKTPALLTELANSFFEKDFNSGELEKDALLHNYTKNGDQIIAASLLASASSKPFEDCLNIVNNLSLDGILNIFKTALSNMEFFDSPPREFEHASLTFEVSVSAAAYGQLKRHRMMTQTISDYAPSLGLTIPPSIVDAGLEEQFRKHAKDAEELFYKIREPLPHIAPYVLTNAHRRRVLITVNVRDLYHFSRLREDAHAQWDIRILAALLRKETENVMPAASILLCGKDSYVERFTSVYNKAPQIDPSNPKG
ncbi:MAG: FAD-dependent thymidylate synthase [Deltaproteobacteria bacterium]|nr:FAD-dependent thymidylate synthase [Deltaproteobacteria bacterium]